MHHRKLVKHVIQHETVHISQREKTTKRPTTQQQLPLLSHDCIQQQQTKYYRKIHMWG